MPYALARLLNNILPVPLKPFGLCWVLGQSVLEFFLSQLLRSPKMAFTSSKQFTTNAAQHLTNNNQNQTERKVSEFWVNVGIPSSVTREDGSTVNITLPFGIPLDSMQYLTIRGQNSDFNNLQKARNSLLDDLRKYAAELQPGEEREIALKVWIRRANEPQSATGNDGDENPYKVDSKAWLL